MAPISLNAFLPRIERSLNEAFPEARFQLGEIQLAWSSERHRPAVHAQAIQIYRRDGSKVISLDDAAVGVSRVALLRGRLQPMWIALGGVTVRLARRADGTVGLALAVDAPAEQSTSPTAASTDA